MSTIAVIGAGAYGTALAIHLARSGKEILLWARDTSFLKNRENTLYLPGISLPETIKITDRDSDLEAVCLALVVIPAQALRNGLERLKPVFRDETDLVLCAKGIEQKTGRRTSEIAREVLPRNSISVLSGPSFAEDVARGLPTAVTLAADTLGQAGGLCEAISSPSFRPYASDDMIGVELGGALKNVIALAVGMARAKGFGASAEAALTTRGFTELSRIARHFGARPETLMGLSCLGDLMLTCSSPQSRNFSYGMAVASGKDLKTMKLAEGVHTTAIAARLCVEHGISAPIIEAINAVISGQSDIDSAMMALLSRPLKAELS